jgi:hypothetical protein
LVNSEEHQQRRRGLRRHQQAKQAHRHGGQSHAGHPFDQPGGDKDQQ